MGTINTFSYTERELEEVADGIKAATVKGLVTSGLLELETADEWCANHTLIMREDGCFKRLLKKLTGREPPEGASRWVIVKELVYD
jgi:hypothetical protein